MNNISIQDEDVKSSLEQRADYIPTENLFGETAVGSNLFKEVRKALLSSSLKTIVGPRGCGKTHMMRHAWLSCQKNGSLPFAVYVSFNKYYRLEPLLVTRTSPPDEFHSWALALIVLATYSSLSFNTNNKYKVRDLEIEFGLAKENLERIVSCLERNQPLSMQDQELSHSISIVKVQDLIHAACLICGRKRTVLLLDDAALTLTPPYLIELLDIVRALKTTHIAPKASVYPGTTEYSARFHVGQDTTHVFVWLSIEAPEYEIDMDEIAQTRISHFEGIPKEVLQMLRFAAFGVPRAYLTMLQEFKEKRGRTQQQAINQVIENHYNGRISEFRSLATKVPKLKTLIEVGEHVLDGMVKTIKRFNSENSQLQLVVGINKDELTTIRQRMFQLLTEAGLVYDAKEVKHGTPERIYKRLIPHSAALLQSRALTSGDSGGSVRSTLEALLRKRSKHPIRRKLDKIVSEPSVVNNLDFSLPPCPKCGQERLAENQNFCTKCGAQLIPVSTFDNCLSMRIEEVPGLTEWQRDKIKLELPKLNTIRDYLAMQDPVAELLTVYGFGRQRSFKIADLLKSFVDDFLS